VPEVDLVDLERAPLLLRGRVLQEGRLLYSADEPGRVAFEVRARSEYFDFLPTQRAHRDRFLRRVAAGGWMVDPDRVHRRLALLAGYLRVLRRLRDLTLAEYLLHEV